MIRLFALLLLPAALAAQTYSTNGDATLASLIEQALESSPHVREAFADYQAALRRVPQVSTLPDPVLAITQHARTPETRVGPQTTLVSLSQRFPWFGKLSDQGKIAAKEAAVRSELYQARRAEVVRQVKLAYHDLATGAEGQAVQAAEHVEQRGGDERRWRDRPGPGASGSSRRCRAVGSPQPGPTEARERWFRGVRIGRV